MELIILRLFIIVILLPHTFAVANQSKGPIMLERKNQYDRRDDLKVAANLENDQTYNRRCEIEATSETVEKFSTEVLKFRYNFIYLNLVFENVSVEEDNQVILYHRWIWTYRGENGGHEYLFLPNDFGYLSFGLLWSYTLVNPMSVNLVLKKNATCQTLIGGGDADQIVGNALGNMTKKIAAMNDKYNSSYWCYLKRLHIESNILFIACEYSICPFQTIEYSCCKYHLDYLTKERIVVCNKHHYHFADVWWFLPMMIGQILFAYFPLLLTSIGSRLRSYSRQKRAKSIKLGEMNSINESEQREVVRISKHKYPVTFLSSVCGKFTSCNTKRRLFSRVIQLTIICVPVCLAVVRITLDYKYTGDIVKAAVAKGAQVGFSSVIADYKLANQYFLHYIGGPFIALPLFFIFGCLLIVVPSNLEELLARGLIEFTGKSSFLLTLSPESKARLAGEEIRKYSGYKRIHKTLLSQALMLLNRSFWKQTFRLCYVRFSQVIFPFLSNTMKSQCLVVFLSIPVFVIYICFSIIELFVSCVYFAFPVISSFFIFLRAYVKYIRKLVRGKVVSFSATLVVVLMFLYTWYLYCLLFFNTFMFLTKTVTFTYSGVIAYPRVSYGYLILSLMALYYISESFNSFRQNYHDLLSLSIKACLKVEENMQADQMKVSILCDDGIPVDLWNLIIERHRPKRIQVAYTICQLSIIICVMIISLELLFRFEKLRDLSLITHVFTAVIICALPKIAKSLCTHRLKYRKQKSLLRKIKQTVRGYADNDIELEEKGIYVSFDHNENERLID